MLSISSLRFSTQQLSETRSLASHVSSRSRDAQSTGCRTNREISRIIEYFTKYQFASRVTRSLTSIHSCSTDDDVSNDSSRTCAPIDISAFVSRHLNIFSRRLHFIYRDVCIRAPTSGRNWSTRDNSARVAARRVSLSLSIAAIVCTRSSSSPSVIRIRRAFSRPCARAIAKSAHVRATVDDYAFRRARVTDSRAIINYPLPRN